MTLSLFNANDIVLGPEPERDAWCSPPELRNALLRFTGGGAVDLDPCTNEHSIIPAVTKWTRADAPTALPIRPWHGTVWCNWPWSNPAPWTEACREEARSGGALWVIGCGINDSSVRWFVEDVWDANAICFPDHRVQFMPPPGAESSSNSHPIALPFWCSRSHPLRREWLDKFERAYEPLGKIIRL